MTASPVPSIGVLDSGVGGFSVLREIHRLMPSHPTLYIADQLHFPYGPRPMDEIQVLTRQMVDYLLDQGAVVIVLACNTASAAALYAMREMYPDVPFVGMEPAVKPATEATRSGVIGVLATQTTARGALYERVVKRYAQQVRVLTQVAPDLVRVAEAQSQDSDEGRAIIRGYVQPLVAAGADQIVLACTHFPLLREAIQAEVGDGVTLVDPGAAVARQVGRVWPAEVQLQAAPNRYITSGDALALAQMARRLLGLTVDAEAWS